MARKQLATALRTGRADQTGFNQKFVAELDAAVSTKPQQGMH